MCGIAGFVLGLGQRASAEVARAMADAITRRGPDAAGTYAHDNVALGHRRLSIIDTSGAANQPLGNEDGSVVTVFNGEIYNFAALRDELSARGHSFRTRSDTEVLVHGWEEYGPAVVDRLRGMFALAIFDRRARRLFLARDRLGKKPLYIAASPAGLWFGSEIKAIAAAGVALGEIDPGALAEYATYGNSCGARTIFSGVRKLLPGHWMVVDTGSESLASETRRYWAPELAPEHGHTEGEWLEQLDAVLSDAVRLRMISDVPLGAFLSGGIDSSLVTAYMTRHASRVMTFAIGFEEAAYDESGHAAEVARALGTEHRVEIVRPDALAVLPELVAAHDEPFADSSSIPTYYLCQMARRHVTVALSGDGGDEVHLGYNRHTKGQLLERANRHVPGAARAVARRLAAALPQGFTGRRVLEQLPLRGFELYTELLGHTSAHVALLRPELRARPIPVEAELAAAFSAPRDVAGVVRFQAADLASYLPDDILVKVDRASMWHSLEVRCPLLDHELVELSCRIPPELKLRRLRGKQLLRKLLWRHVPATLVERPKMGFGVPIATWFRRELAGALDDMVADDRSWMWDYFDRDVAIQYVRRHARRSFDLTTALWRLLFFHAWVDRAKTAAHPARAAAPTAVPAAGR